MSNKKIEQLDFFSKKEKQNLDDLLLLAVKARLKDKEKNYKPSLAFCVRIILEYNNLLEEKILDKNFNNQQYQELLEKIISILINLGYELRKDIISKQKEISVSRFDEEIKADKKYKEENYFGIGASLTRKEAE